MEVRSRGGAEGAWVGFEPEPVGGLRERNGELSQARGEGGWGLGNVG